MSKVKFSIIIPVKAINDYVRETVPYIQAIKRSDWELIILPNDQDVDEWLDPRVRIVASGRVGPGKKRNIGAELASGEILVFLDDDSYPESDFLDIAEYYFVDDKVVALGGPAITPPQDSFWQKVSGAVFLSGLSGGAPERYIPAGPVRPVVDWPSVNLMARRDAFLSVGGFDSQYWPGEDTKLCLDLVQRTGKNILYVPQMKVWHHRREGLASHLQQIGGYGLHRGYFAKRYPATSRKFRFFLPLALALFLTTSLFIPFFLPQTIILYLVGLFVYSAGLVVVWADIRKHVSPAVAIAAIPYVIATHLWYGVRFGHGLFKKELVSRLR